MLDVIWDLLPVALGVVASPLVIMALVAVLLSRRARVNGLAYLCGSAIAVVVALGAAYAIFGTLELEQRHDPPMWVPFARLVFAAVLFTGAVWTYRRAHVAPLDIRLAALASGPSLWTLLGFALLIIVPMTIPVVLTIVKRERAEPTLSTLQAFA